MTNINVQIAPVVGTYVHRTSPDPVIEWYWSLMSDSLHDIHPSTGLFVTSSTDDTVTLAVLTYPRQSFTINLTTFTTENFEVMSCDLPLQSGTIFRRLTSDEPDHPVFESVWRENWHKSTVGTLFRLEMVYCNRPGLGDLAYIWHASSFLDTGTRETNLLVIVPLSWLTPENFEVVTP